MTSPGWMIFAIMLFILCTIIGNVFSEIEQPLQTSDIDTLGEMSGGASIESQSAAGNILSFFNIAGNIWQVVWRSIISDYAFFYDYNENTGERTPNDMMIIRYIVFLPISIAFFVTLGLVAFKNI